MIAGNRVCSFGPLSLKHGGFPVVSFKTSAQNPPSANSKNKSSISLSLYTRAGPQRTQATGIHEALKGPSLALWVGGVRGDQVQPRDSGAPFGEGMGSVCFGTPFWLGLKGNQFRRCPNRDTPVYCLRIRNAISARDRPIEIQQITHKKSETKRAKQIGNHRFHWHAVPRKRETENSDLPRRLGSTTNQHTGGWRPFSLPSQGYTHTPPCHLQRPFSAEKQA